MEKEYAYLDKKDRLENAKTLEEVSKLLEILSSEIQSLSSHLKRISFDVDFLKAFFKFCMMHNIPQTTASEFLIRYLTGTL